MTVVMVEYRAVCTKCKSMTAGIVQLIFPNKTSIKCSVCDADILSFGLHQPVEKEYVEIPPKGTFPTLIKTLSEFVPDFDEKMKEWIYQKYPHGIGLYD